MHPGRHIAYDISMKKFLILLLLILTLPLCAWQEQALEHAILTAPVDEPFWQVYSSHTSLNSRRAVRLGYNYFHRRINTKDATFSDTKIAIFITTRLQPFFNKLSELETMSKEQRTLLSSAYNDEFVSLATELAKLSQQNQHRYTNPIFLDDSAALEETVKIIQEAVNRGRF